MKPEYLITLFCLTPVFGCSSSSNPVFVHVGHGHAVPSEVIDFRVTESGLTREQAIEQIGAEHFERRVEEHADKYGIGFDEARQQLAYADKHESIPFLKMPVGNEIHTR